jgi:hypothetical protein
MNQRRRLYLAILMGCILLFVLLLLINIVVANSLPSLSSTKVFNSMSEIEELELALKSNELSTDDRNLILGKLLTAQREATRKAFPKTDSTVVFIQKQTALAQDTRSPSQKGERPVGLIVEPPYGDITRNAVFSTIWVHYDNGNYYQICAGHLANDKEQGVIYVLIENPRQLIEFLPQGKVGNLVIKNKEGDLLKIFGESNQDFYFELKNFRLLDASGKDIFSTQSTTFPAYS